LKNKKKYLKKKWGVRGAKPPGWLKRLLKQVNISFLIMSKPFQSRLNLPKHEKNLPKLQKNMIFINYPSKETLIAKERESGGGDSGAYLLTPCRTL